MAAKSNIYSEKREDDYGISSDSKLADLYNEDELTSVYYNNLEELEKVLKSDIHACFGKWSIFVAAVLNRRCEELTNVIPPEYFHKTKKRGINQLIKVINATPGLFVMFHYIKHRIMKYCCPKVINLMHWVLVINSEPTLRTVKCDELLWILSDVKCTKKLETPIYVFEIMYPKASRLKLLFRTRAVGHNTYYGFCGYPMDRLYETLFKGMHLVQGAVHLRNDLSEIFKRTTGKCNGNRTLSGLLTRCVAMCQYVDDEKYINHHHEPNTSDIHTFCLREDIVLPRYLFFYGEKMQSTPSSDIDESIKAVEKQLCEDKDKYWTIGCLLAIATVAVWFNFN
ncbi:uncharacterized protein LOC119688535 [Teleopsis dalmanni]|uniref:uncharacterized protein LOC119688535 n=1 Tax=Teleopsis dalmanni TaxID=139649 RepID=UPI0018CE6DC4|nr:uncharacterized protein LOC119688535 [Teleopsis dalmanni]